MNSIKHFVIILMCILILTVDGYRILGIFPFSIKSHNIFFQAVLKGLAKKGHQTDVISFFELSNPPKNYRTILNLSNITNIHLNFPFDSIQKSIQIFDNPILLFHEAKHFCDIMSHEKLQDIIRNPRKEPAYDVIFTEDGAICYFSWAYLFNLPLIALSPNVETPFLSLMVGNPLSTSFIPTVFLGKSNIKTFWDRLHHTVKVIFDLYMFYFLTENQTGAMRRYVSPSTPSIREVERMVSLSIVNAHYTIQGVRPITPASIHVAGLHIEEDDSTFTPDLRQWMDESKNGVVYMSFGTMAPLETLPTKTILSLYSVFAKLAPIKVLMKATKGQKFPPGIPENVKTIMWAPQIPILRHNNTRLFITHGGLHSVEEAIYFGIPIIGMPLFLDQRQNVERLVEKNMCIKLNYQNITENSLSEAIRKILTDAKYREAAKYQSRLFQDRPMKPIDTAAFWMEYIIRNGPQSLRSPAVDLCWWQLDLLDVYCFLIFAIISILYIIGVIIRFFYKIFLRKSVKLKLRVN